MRRRRGFTLLEMIVAFTIMAIAIVGLLSGITGATRNAAKLRDYDRAVQLAHLQMDELLLSRTPGGSGTFDGQMTGGLQAGWQSRVSVVETPPNPQVGQPSLERVELQIWWLSGVDRRTFTLEAYRTHFQEVGQQ